MINTSMGWLKLHPIEFILNNPHPRFLSTLRSSHEHLTFELTMEAKPSVTIYLNSIKIKSIKCEKCKSRS